VQPVFWARYYNYYLEGLSQLFPTRKLSVDGRPFRGWIGPKDGMAVIIGGSPPLRLYFQASDEGKLYRRELRWSHSYGVANLDLADLASLPDRPSRKVVALGPGFGIKRSERAQATLAALVDLPKAIREGLPRHRYRYYVADRRGQALRPPLSDYAPARAESDYVFFASRWWPEREKELNRLRCEFVQTCLDHPDIRFEGGFPDTRDSERPPAQMVLPRRYPASEYLDRVSRSAVVFNTPAVHGCHGWKLGEYLALGKAMISLPLTREMPAPLVHGEHIHHVTSASSIPDAVAYLMDNKSYRDNLGLNARRYWEEHLTPVSQVRRMIKRAEVVAAERSD
jgi:hypothetical protein